MSIRTLVTGDIHIGRHSSSTPPDAREASTKSTWQAIVDYAISNSIDVLLLTGDIIDRDNKYYEAIGPLQTGFDKLSKSGISVFIVAGNHDHDVLPQIISAGNYNDVYLLGLNGNWEEVVYDKKETGEQMRILGWSFPTQYVNDSQLNNIPKPSSDVNIPTIALIHGDLYIRDSRYNPLNPDVLKSISFVDAWLLGHIHRPDIFNKQSPLILYPGSPHALSSKEQGTHGVCLLSVDGHDVNCCSVPFSPVCYETIPVDITSAIDEESFRSIVTKELRAFTTAMNKHDYLKFLIYDIKFTGESNHLHQIESWAEKLKEYEQNDGCHISVRSTESSVNPKLDIARLAGDTSYIGLLASTIQKLEAGETDRFISSLMHDWISKYQAVISASVYTPLAEREENINNLAREYVIGQCKKLIAELNNQKNP